ncbi:MAG: methylmalonyl-CoA epimerase [Flavobacteriales bacterium]|nr:methylmalonyl-CoA epimerase [Flavobacteriales bacterium]
MNKIEHIGIAVKDMEQSKALYALLLGTEPYKQEVVESENVLTTFFKTGESKIELLSATNQNSVIAKFIEKRGEGIHHIAFDTKDIYSEIKRLEASGFQMIHPEPKPGADNKLIAFLHPKSTCGVLVELCMDMG